MDIVERLTAFRDYTGLTNSQFADRAGIPRPTLSQFLSGRNKRMSDDFAAKLHAAYPALNVLWLLFGEGDMVSDANIEVSEGKIERPELEMTDSVADYEDIAPYGTSPLSDMVSGMKENFSTAPAPDTAAIPKSGGAGSPSGAGPAQPPMAGAEKKIKSIMVFYTDNSYEMFTPDLRDAPTL